MDDESATTQPVDSDGRLSLLVADVDAGSRVDRLLGRALAPHWSRSYLAALVEEGRIKVDGKRVRTSYRVNPGQRIEGEIDRPADALPRPEPMDLSVIHVDESLIIVDKPPHLVVHPGSGAKSGTLVNGLLDRFPEIAAVGRADRPGIVHRLDRDTTGAMAIARTNDAARSLVNQFKSKTVKKEYTAVVWGELPFDSDWIELPLGVHPHKPQLRAVVTQGGQPASSFYQVQQRLGALSVVTVMPRTGRTHQIRVHLAHLGFPIVGDQQYGRPAQAAFGSWLARRSEETGRAPPLQRQALHAARLTLDHPATGERVSYEAPLPADMIGLIAMAETTSP